MTVRISIRLINLLFSKRTTFYLEKIHRVSSGRKYFLKDVNFFAHSGSVLSILTIISHYFDKTVLLNSMTPELPV